MEKSCSSDGLIGSVRDSCASSLKTGCLSKHRLSAAPHNATIQSNLPLFTSLYGSGFSSISLLIMALKTCEVVKPCSKINKNVFLLDMGNLVLNMSTLAECQRHWGVGGSSVCLGIWKLQFANSVLVIWKTSKVPSNVCTSACKSDVCVHSLRDIIPSRSPRVFIGANKHCCHVLKSLRVTLALVCGWQAAYRRDFPSCGGLQAYPLEVRIRGMALKISEHPCASFFWVTPWKQLTVFFHWQQCPAKGQVYTEGYR